ncbi:MAG: GNAT family N-acetyltransferase [Methanobacterium sp.]|nr:GNAT family N-acetyltransferase [Methanobacterium sp.]
MKIEIFEEGNFEDLYRLFYETIHSVNAKDYRKDQLDTWAPEKIGTEKWKRRIQNYFVVIAKDEDKIIGFGELSPEGCIEMLYVHKNYLSQKVGQKLLESLIKKAKTIHLSRVVTESSITAKPFFEKQGFEILKKQVKTFNNVDFLNYKMKKRI